ncbi:MAG: iron-containing redox enzyme family protein, partial [Comamonadaceae bacterium]
MESSTQAVHARYAEYLADRQAGAPRRYFTNRAHALYVLRSIAPTKLVDGSWLLGLVPHWRNPRLAPLVRTYVEELGEGAVDKNHVVLYRGLLARYALDPLDDLDDALYHQGVVQLGLGWNAQEFLPEIAGFNLGYEQLPLHLLITAYELNELGLDPYYFTLHVTVDNSDTGHARRACQAVLDLLPRTDDGGAFWRRVQAGAKLGCAGPGTTEVIASYQDEREVLRILRHKAPSGSGSHSDYCRVAGRHVNDWLSNPDEMPAFLAALEQAGWIRRGEPAANSRFWKLLQGERAEMFGVFSSYELQVIHDWIRGEASRDGRPH